MATAANHASLLPLLFLFPLRWVFNGRVHRGRFVSGLLIVPAVSTPFTFRDSLAAKPGPVFVQVQISKVTHCAKVRQGWIANDGAFLWALDLLFPFSGRASFPESRVRSCSGVDGRCLCASESYPVKGAGEAARGGPTCGGVAFSADARESDQKEVTCL